MKKMVATLATGMIILGTAATGVAAEEHTVKAGDSLWNIANENNTSVEQLVQLNNLSGTIIYPNQKIAIDDKVQEETYKVQKGDTLSQIASEFGTTAGSIKEWNNLSSDLIIVGQSLAINGSQKVAVEQPAKEEVAPEPKQEEATPAPKEEVAPEPKQEEATPAPKEEVAPEPKQEEATPAPKEEVAPEPKQEAAPVKQAAAPAKEQAPKQESAQGKSMTVSATAYTAECYGCSGITATGMNLNNDRNAKVIAVDPSVIPLGSKVHVPGYGTAVAGDTGGAIKGNKIDLHVPTTDEALNFGRRDVTITVID